MPQVIEDPLILEARAAQRQRVIDGNGRHDLDEPVISRADRRRWAAEATQRARRQAKQRFRRHTRERDYVYRDGEFEEIESMPRTPAIERVSRKKTSRAYRSHV